MIVGSSNEGRKICCAITIFLGAVLLLAWHLAVNGIQRQALITFMPVGEKTRTPEKTKTLEKTRTLEETKAKPFPAKVLILSRGRSGSSFLGDLFNQHKKMFYLFEPMAFSIRNLSLYESKSFHVLDDLYRCKFTEKLYLNFLLRKHGFFRKKSRTLATFPAQCPRISRISQKCLSKILEFSCKTSSTLVAKVLTHRLPKGGLWGIREILNTNQNLRIVHLLRDPRRIIASMKKAGWFKGQNFAFKAEYVCSSIWQNIKHVLNDSVYYKDRYKLVVFSDMMSNPSTTVVELYDFLRIGPVPEYIFSWIRRNTLGESSRHKSMGTYTTFRNSTKVLQRKLELSEFEERIVRKYCGAVTEFINKIRKNSRI